LGMGSRAVAKLTPNNNRMDRPARPIMVDFFIFFSLYMNI
jgi:hypothetical protein